MRDVHKDVNDVDLPISTSCTTFATLQLQSFCARRTIHTGHTMGACVQAFSTNARLNVVAIVTSTYTLIVLQQQRWCACQTFGFCWPIACFASWMARMTMTILIVFSWRCIIHQSPSLHRHMWENGKRKKRGEKKSENSFTKCTYVVDFEFALRGSQSGTNERIECATPPILTLHTHTQTHTMAYIR